MYDHSWARTTLATARNPEAGKPIGPGKHTRLFARNNSFAIQLHDTDVITYHPNGDIVLESGGWQTVTTKARFNEYSPAQVWSDKKIWRARFNHIDYFYTDSMVLHASGKCSDAPLWEVAKQKISKQSKQVARVKKYAKRFLDALYAGKVPKPGNGDCWFCLLKDNKGKTWGEHAKHGQSGNHIESHIKENYFVPSLLVTAGQALGVSQAAWWSVQNVWNGGGEANANAFDNIGRQQLEKALYRYCLQQLGLPY